MYNKYIYIYFKIKIQKSVQHLQNNQVDIRKKKKDIYDFNPIVDSETENRLKLLPKPIYKYIPKSPISVDSVEEKDKNNEDDKNKQNNKPNNNNENDINTEDFIQFVEPSEEELANRIEYDMDEQGIVLIILIIIEKEFINILFLNIYIIHKKYCLLFYST